MRVWEANTPREYVLRPTAISAKLLAFVPFGITFIAFIQFDCKPCSLRPLQAYLLQ